MRVLFLTNIPSPYRVAFFNELGKHCELTVLFERQAAKDRNSKWFQNNFENFKPIFLKGIYTGSDSALSLSIIKHLSNKKYDIVIIGGYSTPTSIIAILNLWLKKVPFILNADGGFIRSEGKLKKAIKTFLISRATWWICSGEYTKKVLQHYGANPARIYTYPFSSIHDYDILTSPPTLEEKEKLRKKLGIKGEKIVLSVGQFIKRKGFDILIKASKNLLPGTSVYIIGGEPTDEYKQLVRENGVNDRVYFLPFKTKQELREYFIASDVFTLPTREDIWGLVINEAMAYGLPVVTTDKCIAGIELIKNEENGYIVPVEDEITLSEKINVILSNEMLRNQMILKNLEVAKVYTIENMVNKHMKIFENVLEYLNSCC
ncbi:MAG: glycosyltransferase family 4 protein [Fervidobacterium sp.]